MKPLTLVLIVFLVLSYPALAGRRCTGSSSCSACTTCSGCQYCNEGGGTCGVCSIGSSYNDEPEPEPEVNSAPTVYEEPIVPSPVSYDEFNIPVEEEKEETSYAWIWWTLGIGTIVLWIRSAFK